MSIVPPNGPIIPPLAPFPWNNTPYTNVTPLTFRDAATIQSEIERIKEWIRDSLVPHVDTEIANLAQSWLDSVTVLWSSVNQLLTDQANEVNTALANQIIEVTNQLNAQNQAITDQLAAQDAEIALQINNMTVYVDNAVQSIINSTIAVSDPVILGVLEANPKSLSTQFIETKIDESITSQKGALNGIASLNDSGVVPAAQMDITVADLVSNPESATREEIDSTVVIRSTPQGSVNTMAPTSSIVMHPMPSPALHNAFPGLARRANGGYLASWRASSGHNETDGALYVASSNDGTTWETPVLLDTTDVSSTGDVRDTGLSLDGNTHLLTFHHTGTSKSYLKKSTDDGITFSSSTQLPFGFAGTEFISSPIVVLPNGDWVACAYGNDGAGNDFRVSVIRSSNKGLSWTTPTYVAITGQHLYEPNIVSLGGNNVMLLVRTNKMFTMSAKSTDGGTTFESLDNAYPGAGNPHATRLRNGRIVVTYRSVEGRQTGTRNIPPSRGYAAARLTPDGDNWSEETIFGAPLHDMVYAVTVETDNDGEMLCVWAAEDSLTSARMYSLFITDGSGVTKDGPSPLSLAPHLRIAQQFLMLGKNNDQVIPSATWTAVTWQYEAEDRWDGVELSVSDSTFQVNESGLYMIYFRARFGDPAPSDTNISLAEDSIIIAQNPVPPGVNSGVLSIVYPLIAGKNYDGRVYFPNGGTTMPGGVLPYHSRLIVAKIKSA